MYIGKRPSVNTLKYVPRSADPVNPVEGEVQYADGTVRPEGLWVYKNSAWTPVGSGSGSALNYILDDSSTFEGSIGSWVAYSNAAGTSPVDGSGGSPTITFARNTTAPLNGTADGLLSKPASNEQGEGISCDFSIDNAYKNRPLKVKFNYAASANFVNGSVDGVTPSDVQVFLLDTTLTQLIPVFPNTLDGSGQFIGQFQASANTDYRLILHIRSTNALAYTVQVDNFEVSPVDEAFIQADSDWVAYTPTFTGFGTVSTSDMKYRKTGPSIQIRGNFVSGTSTATEARVSMPTGLLSATSSSTVDIAGIWARNISNANVGGIVIRESALNYLTFGTPNTFGPDVGTPLAKALGNAIIASGQTIFIDVTVPIQGWTSGYATPGVSAMNIPVSFVVSKNGGSAFTSDTTIPTWSTPLKDSVGAFNATTGVYTVKIPGDYFVSWTYRQTSAAAGSAAVLVNGTSVRYGVSNSSTDSKQVTALLQNLKVDDTVSVSASVGATLSSSDILNMWSMFKINDPSAFLTINRSTTKYLSGNITANNASITSLNASNLVIGNKYKVSGYFVFTATNASTNMVVKLTNGSTDVASMSSYLAANGAYQVYSFSNTFTATATTIVASTSSVTNCTLQGNGTVAQSHYTIEDNKLEGGF